MHRSIGIATLRLALTCALVSLPCIAHAQEAAPAPQIILVLPAVAAPDACLPSATEAAPVHIQDAEDDDLAPPADPLAPGPLSLGLSGLAGTRDNGNGLDATWAAGLDVGLRVTPREMRQPFVGISLRRITVGGASTLIGDRFAIGASPAVSVGGQLAERIELYAELGVGLQVRFGSGASSIGAAPFAGGGVRFFLTELFSIAVEGALHIPATNGYLLGSEVFPQAAAIFQGGLALAFHLG